MAVRRIQSIEGPYGCSGVWMGGRGREEGSHIQGFICPEECQFLLWVTGTFFSVAYLSPHPIAYGSSGVFSFLL